MIDYLKHFNLHAYQDRGIGNLLYEETKFYYMDDNHYLHLLSDAVKNRYYPHLAGMLIKRDRAKIEFSCHSRDLYQIELLQYGMVTLNFDSAAQVNQPVYFDMQTSMLTLNEHNHPNVPPLGKVIKQSDQDGYCVVDFNIARLWR